MGGACISYMKKTLFIAMLASIFMGAYTFAEDIIYPASTDGTDIGSSWYAGAFSQDGSISGGRINVWLDEASGTDLNQCTMCGGYTEGDEANASGNMATMTGGTINTLMGGYSANGSATGNRATMENGRVWHAVAGGFAEQGECCYCHAKGNTAIVSGGKGNCVYGGISLAPEGDASDNVVIMTGGEFVEVYGGFAQTGTAADNKVHLVGNHATVDIADAQGQYSRYTGGEMKLSVVAGGQGDGDAPGSAVDIYGCGIEIGMMGNFDYLNFHLLNRQLTSSETMVTLTYGAEPLILDANMSLSFEALDNMECKPGASVTLVRSKQAALLIDREVLDKEYGISLNGDPENTVIATGKLRLNRTKKVLQLVIPGAPAHTAGEEALDVAMVNSLWASSAYVREFVRLSGAQGYALRDGDTAVWGGGFGTFMHATGDKGFKSNGGGYGIGVNHAFSADTYAGISLGQGFGSYHNSGKDGAHVHQRAILAAATLSTRITKDFSLGGHLAFGSVRNRADCRLDGASERARWNDTVFNLGARAAYDFHVTDDTAITPFLGLDWMTGAQDTIGGVYGRHYAHGRLHELRMPVGVTVSTSVEAGSAKLLPQLSVAYVPSLAQQLPHADVSGENGDYRVKGYAPGRNAFMLNAGVNAVFSDSWSAGAFYTLETRRHCVDQSVNASVRYTF